MDADLKDESVKPNLRQVAVARAYVQGLESDRKSLHTTEQQLNDTIWLAVQLGAYNRALYKALDQAMAALETGRLDSDFLDRVEALLAHTRSLNDGIWICACGHPTYDHDDLGCQYLGCKPICGVS